MGKGFTSQKGLVSRINRDKDQCIMSKKRCYKNINSDVKHGLCMNYRDIAKDIKNRDFMLKD